jgi:hypothetical protein
VRPHCPHQPRAFSRRAFSHHPATLPRVAGHRLRDRRLLRRRRHRRLPRFGRRWLADAEVYPSAGRAARPAPATHVRVRPCGVCTQGEGGGRRAAGAPPLRAGLDAGGVFVGAVGHHVEDAVAS